MFANRRQRREEAKVLREMAETVARAIESTDDVGEMSVQIANSWGHMASEPETRVAFARSIIMFRMMAQIGIDCVKTLVPREVMESAILVDDLQAESEK